VFTATLIIAVFIGYFSWSAVTSVGGDFINKVLSYTDKIGARIFTASILNDINQFVDAPLASGDILDEDEIVVEPEEIRDTSIVEKMSIQDLLDDIQEKLDIISQQVQELTDSQQEEIEEDEAQEDEKEDDENINQIIYPKILISETQILPIEQRFIKLYNPNSLPVDLTDWYIQRKTETASSWSSCVSSANFEGKTIMPGGYFLISRTDNLANIVLGSLTLTGNNSLALKNPNGEISDIAYTVSPIPEQQNSGGSASLPVYDKILISEVKIAEKTGDKNIFIELYNSNSVEINLDNWYIFRNNSSFIAKSALMGKKIPSNGYFLLTRNGSIWDEQSDLLFEGTLNSDDKITLKNPNGDSADETSWSEIEENLSFGRKWEEESQTYPDTDDNSVDFELDVLTPKAQNIAYVELPPPTLDHIEITTPATKLIYIIGDELDISGLEVIGTYSDGSTAPETIMPADVMGFDSSTPVASQVLTVTVGDQSVAYTVDINPAPILQSIAITTPADKLAYIVGESLDITGLIVTGIYSDGSTAPEIITPADVTGFDSSLPANGQILTINFGGQTANYAIDINEAGDTTPPSVIDYMLNGLAQNVLFNPNTRAFPVSITMTANEPVTWKSAKIYNMDNPSAVYKNKNPAGDGTVTGTMNWDGTLTKPIVGSISDGVYSIEVHMVDLAGNDVADLILSPYTITIDTIAPVLTLNGGAELNLIVGSEYTELGAIADDGSVVNIAGSADTSVPGVYTITYTTTDAAGNSAEQVVRAVIIGGE